jgi:chromosomal replication initiator protein
MWLQVCRVLKETLSTDQFARWIEPLKVSTLQSDQLHLQVPTRFHYDWVLENYLALIQSCCFKIDSNVRVHLKMPDGKSKPAGTEAAATENLPLTTTFNPVQTFENYVVAPFNQFAQAAAQDLCQPSSPPYNPLFIEGPPGLGKTHLLQAIGNSWTANDAGSTAYLGCRSLLADDPTLSSTLPEALWQFLSTIRVLLVDDIHLLPLEGNFQQNIREIFNWCHDVGRQMVFTANRLPHQIPELVSGLRSRLGWGLIVRIREPDLNSCYQVLESFFGETEKPIAANVCSFLSKQGPLNFHEIRECVEKLQEVVNKQGRLPDLKEKSPALGGSGSVDPKRLSIQAIQKEVCSSYSISIEALPGVTKSRPLVIARQVGMYLSRKLTGATYAAIGSSFGGRDHSTVIYACRKVRAEMRRNRAFAERVVEIEQKILGVHKDEN